jgi:hypothetical protein
MRQYRALLRGQGTSIVELYWAGCIINMSGFDLRQAQAQFPLPEGARWKCIRKQKFAVLTPLHLWMTPTWQELFSR